MLLPDDDILYGSHEQKTVLRRAAALHGLLAHDPRFSYQGRTVSHAGDAPDAAETTINLIQLQGYSSVQFISPARSAQIADTFRSAGLSPVEWNQFWGRDAALKASQSFLDDFTPPAGVTLNAVSADTPDETIRAICAASVAAGVLPLPGSVMRGAGPRGVFLYAQTNVGDVVAVGGGYMAYHPDSAFHDEAFWGMLATADEWRGQRLACWVGAGAVLALAEQHGARGFSSGVKSNNPASQAMCARLGITASEYVYCGATDPTALGSSSITR